MHPFTTAATGTVCIGERLHLTIQPLGSRAMAFRPWSPPSNRTTASSGWDASGSRESSTVGTASRSPR